MACHIKIDTDVNKALKGLEAYCGTNCSQFYTYLTTVIKNVNEEGMLEFTPDFKKSWSYKQELNMETSNPEYVKRAILKYFNNKYPDIDDGVRTTRAFNKIRVYGYTAIGARKEAKRTFANKLIIIHNKNKNSKDPVTGVSTEIKENIQKEYVEGAMGALTMTLARRLSKVTGVPSDVIEDNLFDGDNNSAYIDALLEGHEDDVNIQLQNLIALYREFNTTTLDKYDNVNPRLEFITEVLYDSRLAPIRMDKIENTDTLEVNRNVEEDLVDEPDRADDTIKDAEYDTMIRNLDNKMGLHTDFMTHVGDSIRALLGSLPRMTNTGKSDAQGNDVLELDTDNYLGIADVMDANECATVLYHYGRYENPTQMLESIKAIAEGVPGFASFNRLYNILKSNLDLQIAFYRVFKKIAIGKQETVVENGVAKTRISNSGIDKEGTLKFQYLNAIKGTALSLDHDDIAMQLKQFKGLQLDNYNPSKDTDGRELRRLCVKLSEFLRYYYPSIDDLTVRNFVLRNKLVDGSINYKSNLNIIYTQIQSTIKAAAETEENYKVKEGKLFEINRHNYLVKLNRKKDGEMKEGDELIDPSNIYSESYVTKSAEAVTTQLAKMFIPYALVSTPLNSRNVHGNQSSDVINDSMMTNIKQTLESNLNNYTEEILEDGTKRRTWNDDAPIVRLAEHRFQSKQYNFSNILLEHRDDDGNIINRGLFREELNPDKTVKYVPTEYFDSLLKINLFNGASNLDNGSNISYKDMSREDYIGTAWRNFFKSAENVETGEDTADYFMRIPSDAPKTFTITAPRYSIGKVEGNPPLMSIANEREVNKQISDFIKRISAVQVDDSKPIKFENYPIVVSKHARNLNLAAFVEHLQTDDNNKVNIKIPVNRQNSLKPDREKVVRITFRYSNSQENSNEDNNYVMEGVYYDGVLHDAKFVGFDDKATKENESTIDDNTIWEDIRNSIWKNKNKLRSGESGIRWNINKNHVVFKQLRNIFMQELTDMATAVNVIFKTEDDGDGRYAIKMKDGKPVLKRNKLISGNTKHNGLHPVYHYAETEDGKNPIFVVNSDGSVKATGKVFSSDRFILFDYFAEKGANPIKNFGEDILTEGFALFKNAGTNNKTVLHFDADGNVVLSKEQEDIIDKYLEEFILAYVEHGRNRLQYSEGFLQSSTGLEADTLTIADFMLNTHLAYVGFNDLFEGDTKFYKDTQTFLKRAKEAQGSGDPYGIGDITQPIQPGHKELENSPLKNITFGKNNYRVTPYNTFSAITIHNTIKTDKPMLQVVESYLTDKDFMGDKVLTKAQAKELLSGYEDTTVNDAQSYITFDEWIRRISARGQLPKYKPLIDRILDEDTPLTINDIKEFIQVQKNFYYDQYYNPDTKCISPRQIKNAEFVLVPRLIRGTELEKVAELMDKLGVDQLNTAETSKAGQGAKFTLWDESGHISEDILQDLEAQDEDWKSDIMKNAPRFLEYYNYNYLYTQQETPQHMDSENKAGIQVMKKLVDNIDENSPQELKDAKARFLNIYSANIYKSFERLMKRFKVNFDKHGNIDLTEAGDLKGLDYQIFFDALKEEMMRLGLDANLIDYCTHDINNPNPAGTIMPNYMSLVAAKFENVVQSLFNHGITRQTLPGFHAAQITGMGFRKLSEQVDKTRTSNILQYHPQLYKNKENGDKITEREYKLLDKEEQNKFEKAGLAHYVEIMLPANNFGFDRSDPKYANLTKEEQDDAMLKELKRLELDEIIGYRIPTEGKQSACCMKVVGFTDDAYGSTIVVPDAWVSQTGSDFDIDSVYGIQYPTYKDKNGNLHKYEYQTEFNQYDYFRYVTHNTGFKADGITNETYKEELAKTKEERKEEKEKFINDRENTKDELRDAEEEAFNALPNDAVKEVIRAHKDILRHYKVKAKDLGKAGYITQLTLETQYLNEFLEDNELSNQEISSINTYINSINNIVINIVENNIDDEEINSLIDGDTLKQLEGNVFSFDFKNKLEARLQSLRDKQLKAYEENAKNNGLLTLQEFLTKANANPEMYNSRGARNTQLLTDMKTMLTHPHSFEENLSRSNFDDVKAAMKKCITGSPSELQRKARTAYNILDQAEYFEEAMSGSRLKAASVIRDTLCSICNTIHPTLENNAEIKVFYSGNKYKKKDLERRFNKYDKNGKVIEENVHSSMGGFIVTHRMFGWSNDNKNVDGKILTSYSSQTTAHILDNIKFGNIPNVNDLTFPVYKTILDIGSNYDTAVSFIMQPGITRIVNAYNATNSIYAEERGRNYVLNAIRSILDDLNLEYDSNQKIDDLLAIVNSTFGVKSKEMFGKEFTYSIADADNAAIMLDSTTQLARLHEEGKFSGNTPEANINKLLYDLQMVLQYNKINNLAENIRSVAQVSNPDKFGAKQTIFATRQVFDNIVRIIKDNIVPVGDKQENIFRLQVNGNNILSALYPGLENVNGGDDALNAIITNSNFVKDSKYPPLAAFLKYATSTSIKINKTLFVTQSDEFLDLILNEETGLTSVLSGDNRITEKIAKDFQNYVVNYIIMQSRFIQAPLKYYKEDTTIDGKTYRRGFEYNDTRLGYPNEDEASRVFGWGHSAGLIAQYDYTNEDNQQVRLANKFVVQNVNDPTQEEIDAFNTMSPAQKVTWIKRHFRNSGIFKYIETTLFNEYATRGSKAGTQTMKFDEDAIDVETARVEFEKAFTHKNPLVASAAADIIKYAFFVEGYRMGIGNVSKCIPNSVLLQDHRIYGTGIISDTKDNMSSLDTTITEETREELIDCFVRGHASSMGINTYNVRKANGKTFELSKRSKGLIYLNGSTKEGKDLAERYGIIQPRVKGSDKTNSYVRLRFSNKTTLYKIVENRPTPNSKEFFLIPLNELEPNEKSTWSGNNTNNKYPSYEYYDNLIKRYISRVEDLQSDLVTYRSEIMSQEAEALDNQIKELSDEEKELLIAPKIIKETKQMARPIYDMNTNPSYNSVIKAIHEWYPTSIEEGKPVKYIWNTTLSKSILSFGPNYGLTQRITMPDGSSKVFKIYKVNVKKLANDYTGDPGINHEIKKSDKKYEDLVEVLRTVAKYNKYNEVPVWFGDIYAIMEDKEAEVADNDLDGLDFSSIVDTAVASVKSIYHRGNNGYDQDASKISQFWRDNGITRKAENVEKHIDDVIINTAKYLENVADDLEQQLKGFIKDPKTDKYLPVNDIKCINMVKKDPVLRKKYLELLLQPQTIVEEFGIIKDLDIDSEDPNIQPYLEKIKKAVEKMQNLPLIADAYEKFAKQYYDRLTNQPLIKQGLMSVLDGFYRTNWANAMFNDIQETSNPIIQIAMKNFQADLRRKQMEARRRAEEFVKHIEKIRQEAQSRGERFDLSKIITDEGRLIQSYNQRFLDDLAALRQKVNDAKDEIEKYNDNPKKQIEAKLNHLKATLEFNEWKAEHVEQPLVKEYYLERNAAIHKILYGTYVEYDPLKEEYDKAKEEQQRLVEQGLLSKEELGNDAMDKEYAKQIANYYAKYELLRQKRNELRNKITSDIAREDIDKQIDALDDRMSHMRHVYDGDETTMICAEALNDFIHTINGIEHTYFKYDPQYNFEDILERNLNIVQSYEMSGRPSSLYADNPEYVKAKTWLRQNAELVPDYGEDAADVKRQLEEAYSVLKQPRDTKAGQILANSKKLFSKVKKGYRNASGEFDPRIVNQENPKLVENLQKQQASLYRTSNEHPFSDKTLLSNGTNNNTIYTAEFYDKMCGTGRKKSDSKIWNENVNRINALLAPFYNEHTREIDLELIPNTTNEMDYIKLYSPELVQWLRDEYGKGKINGIVILKALRGLYDELGNIRGPKKSKAVRKFIKDNVVFDHNESKYKNDFGYAKGLAPGQFRTALLDLISDDWGDGLQANNFLYGFVRPVDSQLEKYTDKKRTEAIATINKYKERKLSPYYLEAKVEARKTLSEADYNAWIARNNVYNPYSHSYEPIDMWWETVDKAEKYNYYPKYPSSVRTIRDGYYTPKEIENNNNGFGFEYDDGKEEKILEGKDAEGVYFPNADFVNKNYKKGSHAINYIPGSDSKYDNNKDITKAEQEAKDYIVQTLLALATTKDAKKYIEEGKLPARAKNTPNTGKEWIRELLKVVGWTNEKYNSDDDWHSNPTLSTDEPPMMPMLSLVKGKGSEDEPYKPQQQENQSDEDYAEEVKKWEEKVKKIRENNLKIHKQLLDKDWINVISDFIVKAGTYNAVQDNKYELFFAKELIKKYGSYITRYNKRGQKRFKRDSSNSTDENAEFLRKPDKYLIEQFDNQLRRILYDEFKKPNNPKLLKWMSTLQSLTSSQFMMLNVKGGIANVTLGESQIMAEAFAKEFFGTKDFWGGLRYYNSGIHDYIMHAHDDKAGTVAGAIIKFMDVVDYDEHSGVSRLTKDAYEYLRRLRDYGYTPQTAGEHGMQNSAMFSMMLSHRLFINERKDEFGQPEYKYMNLAEFNRESHRKALKEILSPEEWKAYEKYEETMAKNADDFKDFAWFKRDLTTQWVKLHLEDKAKRQAFIAAREKIQKDNKAEFNDDKKHPTLLSQMDLGKDGKLTFKPDSLMAKMDIPKPNGEPSDAYTLLGEFKGRVISVNKYIHGVYDKSGRAQIENTFFGSLLMQYHKHLPVGIMKRYRMQGMWSEERGHVSKGMYTSLATFITTPWREFNAKQRERKLNDEEISRLEGIQELFKGIVDFALNLRLNYRLLPEYDRANVRRMRGDCLAILAAIAVTVAAKLGFDDDDDEDNLVYNTLLYQADRLATEAGQYLPFVAYSEAKKLWQSPIAAGSGVSDLLSSMNLIAHAILEGDEFDGTYKSGKFAGESKLKVYIERRIPIWRGIKSSFIDINQNNKFYKVGENMLGVLNISKRVEEYKKNN